MFGRRPIPGNSETVGGSVEREAEVAVAQLRLFISAYEGDEPTPGTRAAIQLDAARRAVAAYDAVQLALTDAA